MAFIRSTPKKPVPTTGCVLKLQYVDDEIVSKVSESPGRWIQMIDKEKHYPMKPLKILITTPKKPNRTLSPGLRLVVSQQGGFEPLSLSKIEALQRQSKEADQASANEQITTMYPISMEEMGIPRCEKTECQLSQVSLIWHKITNGFPCYVAQSYTTTTDIIPSPVYARDELEDVYEAQLPDTFPLVFGPAYNYYVYHEKTNLFGLHFQCTDESGNEIISNIDRGTSVDRSFLIEILGTYFTKHVVQKSPTINYAQLPEWAKLPQEAEAELNKLGFTNTTGPNTMQIGMRPMITDGGAYMSEIHAVDDLSHQLLESMRFHESQQPRAMIAIPQSTMLVRTGLGVPIPPQNPMFVPEFGRQPPNFAHLPRPGSFIPQHAATVTEIPDDEHSE